MSATLKQFKEDATDILVDSQTSNQDKLYQLLGALSEYKKSLPDDHIEAEMVWVVSQSYPNEGESVYAICSTYQKAEKAKIELAARLTTPLNKFEITEIAFDAGHSFSIFQQEGSFNLDCQTNVNNPIKSEKVYP